MFGRAWPCVIVTWLTPWITLGASWPGMAGSGAKPPGPAETLAPIAESVLQALEASGVGFAVSREEPGRGPIRIYVSQRAAEILGATVEQLVGTSGLTSMP